MYGNRTSYVRVVLSGPTRVQTPRPSVVEHVGGSTLALHADLRGKWAMVPQAFTVVVSYFPSCLTQLLFPLDLWKF